MQAMSGHYQIHADTDEASGYQRQLVAAFERDDPDLRGRYEEVAPKIADLFEHHFTPKKA